MANYKIPVTWEVYGEMEIEADNLGEAIKKAFDDFPYPSIDGTVDGSISIDYDIAQEINKEDLGSELPK